jgi:hypothetical protein
VFQRRHWSGPSEASTAPPPARDRHERQRGDASTSAPSELRATIRAAAIASHKRAILPAAVGMSVRPFPTRYPSCVLIALHVRRFVSRAALPAAATPVTPSRLPRLDKRVLLGDRTTTTPGREDVGDRHPCMKQHVPYTQVHRSRRSTKSEQRPFRLLTLSCICMGAVGRGQGSVAAFRAASLLLVALRSRDLDRARCS